MLGGFGKGVQHTQDFGCMCALYALYETVTKDDDERNGEQTEFIVNVDTLDIK